MSENKATIQRFYDLWNASEFDALPEVLAEDAVFRGSFDIDSTGIEAFREYAELVQEGFPDFHSRIDAVVAEGDAVAVRLTCTGTHRGEVFDVPPTGRQIRYASAAFFTLKDGKITEGWLHGDLVAMLDQLLLDSMQDTDGMDDDDLEDEDIAVGEE